MAEFDKKRKQLVTRLEKNGYIKSKSVKEAMLNVPRELFVPVTGQKYAYTDSPLSTFDGQTISAPHMNAMMCEILDLSPGQKVLEIGTGSGYHGALCAYIVGKTGDPEHQGHLYTIERNQKLCDFARDNFDHAGFSDIITIIHGDGTNGYPEEAPYDRILVTAAGPEVPKPLIEQLADKGILCIPVGADRGSQKLLVITKIGDKVRQKSVGRVVFVPLIGDHGFSQ